MKFFQRCRQMLGKLKSGGFSELFALETGTSKHSHEHIPVKNTHERIPRKIKRTMFLKDIDNKRTVTDNSGLSSM